MPLRVRWLSKLRAPTSCVHRLILSSSSSNERSKLPQLSSKSKLITTVGWVIAVPASEPYAIAGASRGVLVGRIERTSPLTSILGKARLLGGDALAQTFVSIVKMLVGKYGQIQKSREGIVCGHQGKLNWAAQRAQVRPYT